MGEDGKGPPMGRWLRNTLHFYGLLMTPGQVAWIRPGAEPVVLVQSWASTRGTMRLLARRLAEDGYAPELAEIGGLAGCFNTRGIAESAARLAKQVRAIADASPRGRIALIGHSLGGLVCRWFVAAMDGARYVHTLVTLGSPHRGSPLAARPGSAPGRWISEGLRDIRPDAPVIERLRQLPIPDSVSASALFSSTDRYCPRPYAEFEIPEGSEHLRNIEAGAFGHVEMAIDPAVYAIVRAELERGKAHAEKQQLISAAPAATAT